MHDPDTMIASFGPFYLWHHDPCNKAGCRDDSCGWFMRANHGDPEMLKKIRRAIEFRFDSVLKIYDNDGDGEKHKDPEAVPRRTYHTGYFCPNGDPNFSVQGIVLNMFWDAAHIFFGHDWKKSRPWMQRNLFEILVFAENPVDSLRDGIVGTFRTACGEKWDREDALDRYSSCIYGWILRKQRPWYKHPRWHVHHWRLTCWPLKRWPGIRRFFREKNCGCAVAVQK